MDTRSPVDQNALASVLQQAISNALASALAQQTQLLAQTIETGFQRMTLASAAHSEASRPVDRSSPPEQPHQSFEQLFGVNNRPNFETNQDAPPIVSSPFGSQQNSQLRPDRISQIIFNWKLRFSGQSKVSIDDFLYRVEALTMQTLDGNFELLSRYASNLFEGSGSEWYWRYHKSVPVVCWSDLRKALKAQFKDGRTDHEIRTAITQRKQKVHEPFDQFYEAIVAIADRLVHPMSEQALLEVLRANLLPDIQHEILHVPIDNIVQLRRVVCTRERFIKTIAPNSSSTPRVVARRHISEVTVQTGNDSDSEEEESVNLDIEALTLSCWNCGKNGHRYQDCVAERAIFCYGCGKRDTYRPSCPKCGSKNDRQRAPLHSARKLITRATNTE
ncbi:hypothetical protein ACLKA6_000925 [Drosophila palustris]